MRLLLLLLLLLFQICYLPACLLLCIAEDTVVELPLMLELLPLPRQPHCIPPAQ